MTNINLPNKTKTKADPVRSSDWYENDAAIKAVVEGELDNNNLSGSAGITAANLAASAKPLTAYTSKVIATEESRTNTAYGTLTTADKIEGVVVPENGLILVRYRAAVKESVNNTGAADLFLGSTQLKAVDGGNTPSTNWATGVGAPSAGTFLTIGSAPTGLTRTANSYSAPASTGQVFDSGTVAIGAAAGTYEISVRFKASSGTVTAKERSLTVWVQAFT